MNDTRELLGHVFGILLAAGAALLCGAAWFGIEAVVGWQWAIGTVLLSMLLRVNLFVLAGAYLFARQFLYFDALEAVLFAAPGLLILSPAVAISIFAHVTRPVSRF